MKKKYLIISAFFVLTFIFIISAFFLKDTFFKPKPNVIWISLDTQRAKSLDLYGYPLKTSPFLKKIGESSIVFEKTWAQSSVTNLSHFSMLTGTYPVKHKILSIDPSLRLSPNIKMAAEYFKENNYQTLIAGSFRGNPFLNLDVGLGRGADFSLSDDPIKFDFSMNQVLSKIQSYTENKKPFFAFLHGWMVHVPYFPTKECFLPFDFGYKGKIIWDENQIKKISSVNPHFPSLTDPSSPEAFAFISRTDINKQEDIKMIEALYNASIYCQDKRLEKLFTELKKIIPNFNETIIIITADHGESLGEHGLFQHGNMYQNDLWVPLIVHFPKYGPMRIKAPVRSIDILPSVLEYLGMKANANLDGKSFIYLLNAPETRKHFDIAFSQKDGKYAVYQDQYKYIQMNGRELLFDIEKDPEELINLTEQQPELVFKFRNELLFYLLQKN